MGVEYVLRFLLEYDLPIFLHFQRGRMCVVGNRTPKERDLVFPKIHVCFRWSELTGRLVVYRLYSSYSRRLVQSLRMDVPVPIFQWQRAQSLSRTIGGGQRLCENRFVNVVCASRSDLYQPGTRPIDLMGNI